MLDIVVPVYKNLSLTKNCIDSLLSNLWEINDFKPRLILIDDSPDDLEVSRLLADYSQRHPQVTLIKNDANIGFVKSVNKALSLSISDCRDVLLVNSDTQTFSGVLREIMEVSCLDPQIAFVNPRSNDASICSLPHSIDGWLPTPQSAFDAWLALSPYLPRYHFTPTAVGFYMFIRGNVLANFGVLSEDFGLGYEEENDLVMRANKAGYRSVMANKAFVFHFASASFKLKPNINLERHRSNNLTLISQRHKEFLPLVHAYEASAHFRAERLIGSLAKAKVSTIRLLIDLSSLGCHHNGTSEFSVALVRNLVRSSTDLLSLTVLCSRDAALFHDLTQLADLAIEYSYSTARDFDVVFRPCQPFDVHEVNVIEEMAPIVVYAMLDTIALDCGYLSTDQKLQSLWEYVAGHSNGLVFISDHSKVTFLNRFPAAKSTPLFSMLLPTKLNPGDLRSNLVSGDFVLVLGNHFSHKASMPTAELLARGYPRCKFVVLGASNQLAGNLRVYQSGTVDESQMANLFRKCSAVVLPSHYEGFGFGLVHALSAGKFVFARNIPATREILSTYNDFEGVVLYENDIDLVEKFRLLREGARSSVDDSGAADWSSWSSHFVDFVVDLVRCDKAFQVARDRITAGDSLRARLSAASVPRDAVSLNALVGLPESEFVSFAYRLILNREADSEGRQYYSSQLAMGLSRVDVIKELALSSESRSLAESGGGVFYSITNGNPIATLIRKIKVVVNSVRRKLSL